MTSFWNRWTGLQKSSRRKNRKRTPLRRRPRAENLETRQLLAANIFHNEPMPEDVDQDGIVLAVDTLTILNQMNRQGANAGGEVDGNGQQRGQARITDVNNDDQDTALDALMAGNRLNRDRGGVGGSTDPADNPVDTPVDDTTDNTTEDSTDVVIDDDTTPTSQTETDVVLEWNDLFGEILVDDTQNQNPGYASRSQAILNLAIYDAVAIATSGNDAETFYDYDLNLSQTDKISAEVAASQAAYTVLSSLYPDQQGTLDAFLETSLSSLSNDGNFADSLEVGTEIGNEILAIRASDGSDVIAEYTYTDEAGYFQPDPLNPDVAAWGPTWGDVDTFAISSSDDFRPETTPALTSEEYAASYNEVLELGSADSETRTADQTEAGIFWAYDREGLGTPIALFNDVLQTIAVQEGNTIEENAALFAQASVAMADAGITAWDTKFTEEFWRPVTAIQAGDTDGNDLTEGDADWVALGAPNGEDTTGFTPQFPTYISGHATFGAALFGTLQEFYGTDDISFDVTSAELEMLLENPELQEAYGLDLDDATRTFDSFSEAMAENGVSRVYLGIHFDFDDLVGQEVGQAIATSVASEFVVASDDESGDSGFVNHKEDGGNFAGQGGNNNGQQGQDDPTRRRQRDSRFAAVDSVFAQGLF
ncbi:PAP2 superfamily protein [Roseimaritima multifibrata]|uniref:PAP2 superfamily protein n=1 Tax=Roseimaritima multifibrata TaxID=1930274 RepID=A0A517MIM3_9BACT|nr:phosphatase PAP2 family protein [Roseimaritima multifibrata]QDS94698.1 PAP2 superfamily protein [Roseimaritima multifibrata]